MINARVEKNRIRRLAKRRMLRDNKTCIVCGAVFGAKRVDCKYCSDACKQKHFRNGE